MKEEISKIESRRNRIANSEEWQNFTGLIDESRRLFNPDAATLRRQVSNGQVIRDRRVSDLGISFLYDYTAGVLSEMMTSMMTSGEQWFVLDAADADDEEAVELKRQTAIIHAKLGASRFVAETGGAILASACDGTVCEYVETGFDGKLRFCKVPFGCFWFETDYHGASNRVWVEKKTTVGALADHYGEANISEQSAERLKNNPNEEISVIHYCGPRKTRNPAKKDPVNKPYELLIYEKSDSNPHQLQEGGTDSQMFHVYRVATTDTEILGRGPCINAISTMNEIEQVVRDMRNARRLKVVPTLALPASQGMNSYRWIHEESCSYLLYDNSGISGEPPKQLISPADINEGEEWVEWLAKLMRSLFFLDYFNPLQERRNMTFGEAKERVQKSQQMVSRIVEPLEKELLTPLLKRTYELTGQSGAFDAQDITWKDIRQRFGSRLEIRFTSRLANSQKMVQLAANLEAAQQILFVAQAVPEPMLLEYASQINWARYPRVIIDGTNADKTLLRSEKQANALIAQFRQAQAQAKQAQNINLEADTIAKISKAAEPGSGIQDMLKGSM